MAIDEPLRRSIATELKVAMVRERITQSQLADALAMSQPSVSARLAGTTPSTVDELAAAARFCGVRVADLVSDAA